MICKKCNKEIDDLYSFCPYCGSPSDFESTDDTCDDLALTEKETLCVKRDESKDGVRSQLSHDILKWGILSLAFSISYPLSPIGFFFSFAAKKLVKEYEMLYGRVTRKSRVGRDLGKAGFIVGLILSIILILSSVFNVFSAIVGVKILAELLQELFEFIKSLT